VIKQRHDTIFVFYARDDSTSSLSVRKVGLYGGVGGMILLNLSTS